MDKVIGGTPKAGSLCLTCRCAQIVRGVNLQMVIYCQALPRSPRITFAVAECSFYDDKLHASLMDMRQIAWQVESRNRGQVGFGGNRASDIVISPPDHHGMKPWPAQSPEVAARSKGASNE